MRVRERRAARARAVAIAVIVGALPTLLSCRQSAATQRPRHVGDISEVQPERLQPLHRAAWDQLQAAVQADPAGSAVVETADALLGMQPPIEIELAAQQAKAEHAYLNRLDPEAVLIVDQALSGIRVDPDDPAPVIVELARVRARAMVRGGDPARAVVALEDPVLSVPGALDPVERFGLRAVALDRNAQFADAVAAYARWRAQVAEHDPAAVFAEQRIAVLGRTVDPAELVARLEAIPNAHARQCVAAKARRADPASDAPAWVGRCGGGANRVGVLLPRTGPLSALADVQLAAASVAIPLLLQELDHPVEVLWRDAGSSAGSATAAARALVAAGADVLVGPIGQKHVRAVAAGLGENIPVVVPGEGSGRALGVAPTLEARIDALLQQARALGARRFVLAAPSNTYGDRAVAAVQERLEQSERKTLIIQRYEPGTTSFAPIVAPLLPALRSQAALLIPDHVARVELFVRQLARSGSPPAVDGREGALVLSTAEGASPAALGSGHEVMEGLWLAPTAYQTDDADAFVRAYAQHQGTEPGDQALLVYRALRAAILGAAPARAMALAVQGGRLVQDPSPPA